MQKEISDYNKVMDKLVACVDGSIQYTKAELTRKAFKLKLSNYSLVLEYYNEFVALKSKNKDLEEATLIEAFLEGIHISTIRKVMKREPKPTLMGNLGDLERNCEFYCDLQFLFETIGVKRRPILNGKKWLIQR